MRLKDLEMKPEYFEMGSYLSWGATALAIPTIFKNKRDYWYALLGGSLLFPFEYFADNHLLFMIYSEDFTPLVSRSFMPLFLFFAYGWFFASTLIANLHFEEKLDAMPLRKQIALLCAVFMAWDFAVEYSSTSFGFWTYHGNVKKIGNLPWHVPFGVAIVKTGLYYVHKAARERSAGRSWLKRLLIHA